MRASVAIVAGLAIGIGAGWWLLKKDRGPAGQAPAAEATAGKPAAPAPRLYRWRDAQGVLQVSDRPPAEGPYEEVKLRDDQNVVPLSGPAPAPVSPDD